VKEDGRGKTIWDKFAHTFGMNLWLDSLMLMHLYLLKLAGFDDCYQYSRMSHFGLQSVTVVVHVTDIYTEYVTALKVTA